MSPGWPASLRLVRHTESAANVDSEAARQAGLDRWDTGTRDPDVALTARGERAATALGSMLARLPASEVPSAIWTSPFVRSRETARLSVACCGSVWTHAVWRVDERLRDREAGVLEQLTWAGIQSRHPELADLRRRLGKFYFRAPGGESWADVALRLRSVLVDIRGDNEGEHVIVFAHDVVVLLLRYIIESLDESQILDIGRRTPVRNGSMTTYRLLDGRLRLVAYNAVADPD